MPIDKIKHLVQRSFENWITLSDGIAHPCDEERFFVFVKTVYSYHARLWKDPDFLKEKVLEIKPKFGKEKLKKILEIYKILLNFCKVKQQNLYYVHRHHN